MTKRRLSRVVGEALPRSTPRSEAIASLDDAIAGFVDLDVKGLCLAVVQPLERAPSRPFAALAALEDLGLSGPSRRARRAGQRNAAHPASAEGPHARIPGRASFRGADSNNAGRSHADSGALLTREWNGNLERVMVLERGFAWNGETYGSLSQVANAMTGTSWNGHRFFGLRTAKSDRSATAGRRGGHDDVASADVGSRSIKESRAAHIRGSRREEASP